MQQIVYRPDRGVVVDASADPFSGTAPKRQIAIAWRRSFPRPKAISALHEAVMGCDLAGVSLLQDQSALNADDAFLDAS